MHEEVVIRHAASNQLQRNAPHCKPPAAPKRPPDRRQTAPAPACAYPALRLAITDEASPLALRSTRNRLRKAPIPKLILRTLPAVDKDVENAPPWRMARFELGSVGPGLIA
jgi:hypothetical protein